MNRIKSLIDEGRSIAKTMKIGRTAFMDEMSVASEEEYTCAAIKAEQVGG